MPLNSYHVMIHYDPGLDAEAICIVGYTGKGSYWIRTRKAPEGRKRREQKEELLIRLAAAVEKGQPPGEVSMDDPLPERLDDDTFDPGGY